jgi:hypothetical protein
MTVDRTRSAVQRLHMRSAGRRPRSTVVRLRSSFLRLPSPSASKTWASSIASAPASATRPCATSLPRPLVFASALFGQIRNPQSAI